MDCVCTKLAQIGQINFYYGQNEFQTSISKTESKRGNCDHKMRQDKYKWIFRHDCSKQMNKVI